MKLKLFTILILLTIPVLSITEIERLSQKYSESRGIAKTRIGNDIGDLYLKSNPDSALYYSLEVLRMSADMNNPAEEARAALNAAKAYRSKRMYTESNNVLETRLPLLKQSDIIYSEALDIMSENYGRLSDWKGKERSLKALLEQVKKKARKDDSLRPVVDVLVRLADVRDLDETEVTTYFEIANKVKIDGSMDYSDYEEIETACLVQLNAQREKEVQAKLAREKILRDAATKEVFEQRGDSLEVALGKVSSTLAQLRAAQEREATAKRQDSITRLINDSLAQANYIANMEQMRQEKERDSVAAENERLAREKEKDFEQKKNVTLLMILILIFVVIFMITRNKWHKRNEKKLNEKNAQLEIARKDAEAANVAKSEFLANMSHEIRTPLNAILGFSELLSTNVTDPKNKGYVESITVSGKNLLNIINDILDLSKIEAGRMDLECNWANLNQMLEEISSIFSIKAKEKKLKFIIDTSNADTLLFNVDEVRLRQVLINLTGNAMKFTDEGSIILRYRTENINADKKIGDLIISVEDTGIGIPENQLNEIFAAFKQKSGQNTKKYGGTGLGLAISKRLINMMQGDLMVKSKLGVGSTFTIKLTNINFSTDFAESTSKIDSLDTSKIRFAPATVLITDDIDDNRRLLREYIAESDFTIYEAENGLEAVAIAREALPDVILMDLRMPEMDGYKALEEIRKIEALKEVPIIAQTASVMKKEQDEIFKFGFDSFLEKPASKSRLFEEMMRFLKYEEIETVEVAGTEEDTPKKEKIKKLGKKASENKELILAELENNFKPALMDLAKTLRVRQIREVIGEMAEFAGKYEIEILNKYIAELDATINSFNRANIKSGIEDFTSVINKIKEAK
jgi:signal transduction histidine kinase/CheY-like chemotaxis protein